MRTPRLAPLMALALLALAACSEDSDSPTTPGPEPEPDPPTRVLVLNAADDAPVAGVKIVLMDSQTNTPLVPPLVSDENGLCDFDYLPDLDISVLVYGGGLWRSFGVVEEVPAEDPGSLMGPAKAEPRDFLARVTTLLPPPGGVHISGIVTDSATGDTLSMVFLSNTTWQTGYLGGVGPSDDVTGDDGAFRVSEIPFMQEPGTGNPMQAVPLFITRHGYRPRVWVYPTRPGELLAEITGVVIPLDPDDGTVGGSLRGRLVRQGEPLRDIIVGLGTATSITSKGGAGLTGYTAVSDSEGVFVFADLPADRYVIYPGYLPGDRAFFPGEPTDPRRYVVAGEETDAGDLLMLWELDPISPPSGTRVPAMNRDFVWEAVPGAAAYNFSLDGNEAVTVTEPMHTLPGLRPLAVGNHYWWVVALDEDQLAIGGTGQNAEFHVAEETGDP